MLNMYAADTAEEETGLAFHYARTYIVSLVAQPKRTLKVIDHAARKEISEVRLEIATAPDSTQQLTLRQSRPVAPGCWALAGSDSA